MMKDTTRKRFYQIIIVLSIIGVLTSFYLVKNHYVPPEAGSLCDFGENISCSYVNTSVFSKLLDVPVSLLGAIWFLFTIIMALSALKKEGSMSTILLSWSFIGMLFVIYFIVAEFILQAICPFCTVAHVIVLVILAITWKLHTTQQKKRAEAAIIREASPWITAAVIINLAIIILFNIQWTEPKDYTETAKCLTEKGLHMYSSFRCGVCAQTREVFGDAFQYISEIECHPDGKNSQTERCLSRKITKTPTWIVEEDGNEIRRFVGYHSPEDLAAALGCPVGA